MRRRLIFKRSCGDLSTILDAEVDIYAVLSKISSGYPPLEGRLSTCYSPVRHGVASHPVRLACIKHAASVHPEPGSNSLNFIFSALALSFNLILAIL